MARSPSSFTITVLASALPEIWEIAAIPRARIRLRVGHDHVLRAVRVEECFYFVERHERPPDRLGGFRYPRLLVRSKRDDAAGFPANQENARYSLVIFGIPQRVCGLVQENLQHSGYLLAARQPHTPQS